MEGCNGWVHGPPSWPTFNAVSNLAGGVACGDPLPNPMNFGKSWD
jgi:hypothetical protein